LAALDADPDRVSGWVPAGIASDPDQRDRQNPDSIR
jgi:hypothetical protein